MKLPEGLVFLSALVGHEEGSKGLSVQWVGQTLSGLVAASCRAGPVQQ